MQSASVYEGRLEAGDFVVYRNGKIFSPESSQKLRNHSPDGFAWGYGGSGPAQLALAILLEETGSGELALNLYQDFKWNCIAKLPRDGFTLTTADMFPGGEIPHE